MNRTQAGLPLLGRQVLRVAADLVRVPLAFASGPVVSGVVYGIFFSPALPGFRERRRRYMSRLEVATI